MSPELSYHLFNKLGEDNFSLIYMGEFDDELTATVLRINESSIQEPKIFKWKLSVLIVECFQNIIHHADKPELVNRTNNKPRMFMVRNVADTFCIASTNLVDNTKTAGLTAKLQSINTLSKEDLKTAYQNALASGEFTVKGGAGLGLMEMARKSGSKLEFDFEFVNYFFSIFFMQFKVTSINPTAGENPNTIPMSSTRELYNSLVTENILMLRKGDFSQEAILPLMELIETNLNSKIKTASVKKKTLYILIELLQNVSKHALEEDGIREGIFMVSFDDNKYILNTGNYIETTRVEGLRHKLKNLLSLEKEGLDELYKSNLKRERTAEEVESNGGFGLIEMCKYSTEKLKFKFVPVSDTVSFFSINVSI